MFRLLGLVVLVLDIVALVSLLKSNADTGTKILWVLLIVLLPLLGMILYFLMGPGPARGGLRHDEREDRFPRRPAASTRSGSRRSSRFATASSSCSPRARRSGASRAASPTCPTPHPIKDAMTRALQRNQTRYAPSSGLPELRTAIVAKVARRNGIPADKDSPIVTNGGMHGLFAAFATLVNPGDEVLLFSPYWTPIVDVIAYHGRPPGSRRRPPRRAPRRALPHAREGGDAEDEGPLLELARQPDRRGLHPRRGRRRSRASSSSTASR